MKRALYFLLLIACSLGVTVATAKKLYKYQDEQGKWHFTDKPPETSQKVDISQLKAEPKMRVRLHQRGDQQNPEYEAQNDYYGPVEMEVVFVKGSNVRSTPRLPKRFVVPAMQSKPLFNVGAVNRNMSWGYVLQYRYMIGSPDVAHNFGHLYHPPIAVNERYQITQAFGGEFSHTSDQSRYAVDIAMPVDTPIYAARGGIVMEVQNDFIKGGTDNKAYMTRANSIRILHDDGSMAIYAHLALEKAQVYPGLRVNIGQLIGYSGNTGFSTGPHLHFAVQVNQGMKLVSVPFMFSSAGKPEVGMWLDGR